LIDSGPHDPTGYGSTGGGFCSSGSEISHSRSIPSDRVNSDWSADHGEQDEPLVALERVRRGERVLVVERHLGVAQAQLRSGDLGQEVEP